MRCNCVWADEESARRPYVGQSDPSLTGLLDLNESHASRLLLVYSASAPYTVYSTVFIADGTTHCVFAIGLHVYSLLLFALRFTLPD